MVNPEELWVGDWLLAEELGLKGRFHGVDPEGNVILKTKDHVLLTFATKEVSVTEDDIDLIPEVFKPIHLDEPKVIDEEDDFEDSIDLHYEILIQSIPHRQGSKLEYQLQICFRFIQAALKARLANIQIIYGRGQGILKQEVELMLKEYPEITIISANPNMASVDAWLNYH